jgi:predicted alpha/beta superfamily hydrolase
MPSRRLCSAVLILVISSIPAIAQTRVPVTFSISQTTSVGQSVYVLGDLPELGSNDLRRAIKLEPSAYPNWKATLALPANRDYSFRYYIRSDAPADQQNASNGSGIGTSQSATAPAAAVSPVSKTILYHSAWNRPILFWRQGTGAFQPAPMNQFGKGRTAGERRWLLQRLGQANRPIEFYIQPQSGTGRDPASGTYSTNLDSAFIQDGQLFSYVPASTVSTYRRDYNPSSPPGINSTNLAGEFRRYRVLLPRGYDQHTTKRYPVIYMHDGQNVFESGSFGSWNAHIAADAQVRAATMRECIIVGVDNTSNRFRDYTPPGDITVTTVGQGDKYVQFIRDELKPIIDANYRTLTGPDDTGAVGSSLGGLISLFMGWDYTATFRRVGPMSGAWSTNFYNRVQSQTRRPIRIAMDSGDSGTLNDNYWPTYNLRDNLLNPARAASSGAYQLQGDLQHTVGLNQQHNEAAWSQRVGGVFSFLFPATEGPQPLNVLATPLWFDVNNDGVITINDLYAQHAPALAKDINADGMINDGDADALEAFIRNGE